MYLWGAQSVREGWIKNQCTLVILSRVRQRPLTNAGHSSLQSFMNSFSLDNIAFEINHLAVNDRSPIDNVCSSGLTSELACADATHYALE